LFWLISRTATALYRRFPLFGPIPGSIAVIRRDGGILAVRRSDGFGIGLPGGIVHPWESADVGLRREVLEETGLTITFLERKFTFENNALYPARTTVFEAKAEGELRSSWEGKTGVFTMAELEREIIPSQRTVLDYLRRRS